MDDSNLLPMVFGELIERANKIEQLTDVVMAEYYAAINNDESLIPEVVSILGPNTFELLVKYFGGHTIRIPKSEDILATVRRNNGQ